MPGFDIFSYAAGYRAGEGGGGGGGNLPPGGTKGQVLVKQSDEDFNASWEDPSYTFEQMTAESVWTIVHNLNRFPSVTVVDSAGSVAVGDVQYTTVNSLTITFSAAFSGKAYLN